MAFVTIKDLARELGISVSTVSKALHNMPDVSARTREAVLDVAQKLNYRPNPYASALPRQKNQLIGAIVPVITHHLFSGIIAGIQEVSRARQYQVIVSESDHSREREELTLRSLLGMQISGLLIGPFAENESHDEHVRQAQLRGIPVVFFDGAYERIRASRVIVDDFDATVQAVEYLLSTGCRQIAHISGPRGSYIGKERIAGYRAAMHKYGLPVREEWIVPADFSIEHGKKIMQDWLAESAWPDAVIAVNDLSAIGALKATQEKGLRVPEDISFIGYSDNPFSSVIDPPLTTIYQPAEEMGKMAATLLLDQIEGISQQSDPQVVQMATRLIIRKSTR